MLRVELPWNEVELTSGAFVWTYQNEKGYLDYDQLFNRLIKRDIRPVAVLSGGPVYLSHLYPQQPVSREGLLENWENYVRAAVQQFGKQVDYWQVGGILNDPQYWGKLMFPAAVDPEADADTELYAEMLKSALQHHQVSQRQRYGHIRRPGPGRRLHQPPTLLLTDPERSGCLVRIRYRQPEPAHPP